MKAAQITRQQDASPPGFESLWATLKETDRMVREVGEIQRETTRQVDEYNKRLREFARRFCGARVTSAATVLRASV